MKKLRPWLLVPLLGLVAIVGARWLGGPESSANDEPPTELFGRVWLEKIPEKPTDYIHGAFVVEDQPVGVFERGSAYDFHFELFQYDRDGGKLALTFPQSERKAKLAYTVKACDDLPPFDLCLTLSENPWSGAPRKYHGFRDQDDESKKLPGVRAEFVARAAAAARHTQ